MLALLLFALHALVASAADDDHASCGADGECEEASAVQLLTFSRANSSDNCIYEATVTFQNNLNVMLSAVSWIDLGSKGSIQVGGTLTGATSGVQAISQGAWTVAPGTQNSVLLKSEPGCSDPTGILVLAVNGFSDCQAGYSAGCPRGAGTLGCWTTASASCTCNNVDCPCYSCSQANRTSMFDPLGFVTLWYNAHTNGDKKHNDDDTYVVMYQPKRPYTANEAADYKSCAGQGSQSCSLTDSYGSTTTYYYCTQLNSCQGQMMCGQNGGLRYRYCNGIDQTNTCSTSNINKGQSGCTFTMGPDSLYGYTYAYKATVTGGTQRKAATIILSQTMPAQAPFYGSFSGGWKYIGIGIESRSFSIEFSTSKSDSSTQEREYKEGLSVGAQQKAGVVFASAKMNEEASMDFYQTQSSTVSEEMSGSAMATCTSFPCANGTLYQFFSEGVQPGSVGKATLSGCSFVCVPAGGTQPVCPPAYCNLPDCQCCTAPWASNSDPQVNHLCGS